MLPRKEACRLIAGSGRRGSINVYDCWPDTSPGDDQLALEVARVRLAMDRFLGHEHEVASYRIQDFSTKGSRLHMERAGDDIDGGVVVTMMMPARSHVPFGANQPRPQAFDGDRLFASHTSGWVAQDPVARFDSLHRIRSSHNAP